MNRTDSPSLIMGENSNTPNFALTLKLEDGKHSKKNLSSNALNFDSVDSIPQKGSLVISLENMLVYQQDSSSVQKSKNGVETDFVAHNNLMLFLLTLAPLYRICLVSTLDMKIIDDILIQENIYSLIEGYLCSFHREDEESGVVAAYVTVNSQFTEKDFKNGVYVNVPDWLFSNYQNRFLGVSSPIREANGLGLQDLMTFLVHFWSNPNENSSVKAAYQTFQKRYGGLLQSHNAKKERLTNVEEGEIDPQDCDDSKDHLRYRTTGFSMKVMKNRILSCHLEQATDYFDDGGKSLLNTTCFTRQVLLPSIASFTGKRTKSSNSFMADRIFK